MEVKELILKLKKHSSAEAFQTPVCEAAQISQAYLKRLLIND